MVSVSIKPADAWRKHDGSTLSINALDDGAAPRDTDDSPAAMQPLLLDQIHQIAFHQRLPIESIRAVEQNFIFTRGTTRLLAGTDQHVDQRSAGHAIRMADEDRRVRSRIGKVEGPNAPLFYSASTFKVEALAVRRSARLSVPV